MSVNCSPSAAIMCPDLADPTNGRVTFSVDGLAPFVLDTVATYNCMQGYGLSSTKTRTCIEDDAISVAIWNSFPPTCSQ